MKKNYYLTLDTETATLPFIDKVCKTAKEKQKISIAKPLVYDIAWTITDRQGNIIKQCSYLVQEIFFVPIVFNTAYYKEKRPLYMEKLQKGEIKVDLWHNIIKILETDLQNTTIATAYNATFDFKKAIPFTERYIRALYSNNYHEWEEQQKTNCKALLSDNNINKNKNYLDEYFELKGNKYPICDLWSVACRELLNNSKYKNYCLANNRISASGLYFSTNAESAFQYLTKNYDFEEEHTALSDAIIESMILTKVLHKKGIKPEIKPFPFKALGEICDYLESGKGKKYAPTVAKILEKWLTSHEHSPFYTQVEKKFEKIQNIF